MQLTHRTNRIPALVLTFFFVLTTAVASLAQHVDDSPQRDWSIIKGQVINTRGKPLSNINVALVGTYLGAATNEKGYYNIGKVPAGSYTIIVTAIGYEKEKKSIAIGEGQILTINVTLSTSNEKLGEIVVKANKINDFGAPRSSFVAKLPIKKINNPQVYNTITSELLESQVITSFDDALKNAPGLFKLWGSTGRGGDGGAYYSLRGFTVQPTMVNGLPALTNGTMDPANIQRIEVIKGPSGTLYGSSLISYGGLINVVTKKPYRSFGGEISYMTGSFGLNRVVADINTPLGKDEDIAIRAIGAFHTQNSFQDAGFKNSVFFAPSLSYQVNDRLSFLINTAYYTEESTNPAMLFLNRSAELEFDSIEKLNYNYKHSFTNNDVTISNETFNLQAQMQYKLSEHWTSQTALSRSSAKADGIYTYLWGLEPHNSIFARYASNQNATTLATDIQQNFIGEFSIAGMNNKMVVGLDYFQQRIVNNSTGYVVVDKISLLKPDTSSISGPEVQQALAGIPAQNSTTQQKVYSAYFSDVINVTSRLSAMVSLRIDHFNNIGDITTDEDNYSQTALSPKFGIVFQPIDDKLSLFANYMNGFSNVAPRVQDDGSVKTFEPERANQWETGVKANLFNGRLTATASYYDIRVSNVVRQDPERVNYYIQDGENYSRGFEASITAAPLPGLNIIAGYSYNVSEVTKASNNVYLGRRPEGAGPQHLANAWISYQLTRGPLTGLGLGFGGNYASKNLTLNRSTTGVFALPSFTVLNASIFYNTASFRIDLKVDNLTDKIYYKGWNTVNPQQPRSITASFSYKF